MGYGDEIMAIGHATRLAQHKGEPVEIRDRNGNPRWHPLWEGNPHIVKRAQFGVTNGPGARPYIKPPFTFEGGQTFTDWRARDYRGRLYLTEAELDFGIDVLRKVGPFVLIEPTIKALANQNKRWPYWERLAGMLGSHKLVQVGAQPEVLLPGATFVQTATFRQAAAVVLTSRVLVAPEGGLHHAAAALRKPAVVIFGGSPSEQATGYPEHVNFGGDDPCGRWQPCTHCKAKMSRITPEAVAAAVERVLHESANR